MIAAGVAVREDRNLMTNRACPAKEILYPDLISLHRVRSPDGPPGSSSPG